MNSQHYPSLELCKKLTDIGFSDTENYYTRGANKRAVEYYINRKEYGNKDDRFICPSVMEMLDVMPDIIKGIRASYYLMASKSGVVQYMPDNFHPLEAPLADYRGGIPNALAEMILWLHDNKYLTFSTHD